MQPREHHLFFNSLSEDRKRYFRKFEKFSLKMINVKKATRFNINCIREKLCPKGIKKNLSHDFSKQNQKVPMA